MSLAVVVLPHPDSPTRARVLPCCSVKLMSSTAFTQPMVFISNNPLVTGKCFFKFWTLRSGVSAIRLAASSNLQCDPLPRRKRADTRFHNAPRYRDSVAQTDTLGGDSRAAVAGHRSSRGAQCVLPVLAQS